MTAPHDDFFAALLARAKAKPSNPPRLKSDPNKLHPIDSPAGFKYNPPSEPDAVVLLIVKSTCQGCGIISESSNQWLMLRYKRNYSYTKFPLSHYPHLPTEIRIVENFNVACRECWPKDSTIINHFAIRIAPDLGEADDETADPNGGGTRSVEDRDLSTVG